MPKVNLSGMSVEALIDLRKRVDETLVRRRADIDKQLARMAGGASITRRGGSALKGRKVPPNIVVPQAKLGQVVAQNLVGLLLR